MYANSLYNIVSKNLQYGSLILSVLLAGYLQRFSIVTPISPTFALYYCTFVKECLANKICNVYTKIGIKYRYQ